ncbi:MAG: hypothetical protein ACLSVD_09715 [Eggerthellaceae bacterium]
MPIDPEHGAIYQCLLAKTRGVALVGDGAGDRSGRTRADLAISRPPALAHHVEHGRKISIDSSTLMNKVSRSSRRTTCSPCPTIASAWSCSRRAPSTPWWSSPTAA